MTLQMDFYDLSLSPEDSQFIPHFSKYIISCTYGRDERLESYLILCMSIRY